MYKRFYNLQQNPFEITPDPRFLVPTKKHNEALASLYYGVRRRKGFVVLTGEVGTGKTVLVRSLLQLLNLSGAAYAYVFNPRLTPTEFLQYISGDFGLPITRKSKAELLLELGGYAISRHKKQLATVLVIDEAHHLSINLLEEVRLLTNLETGDAKLLQILLVGQPELNDKLDSSSLRQLKQRIAHRAHLNPLEFDETCTYICRRWQLAGGSKVSEIFPNETIHEIHRLSRGYPRLINTICENALIHGYAQQSKTIGPEVIAGVAADFRLGILHRSISEQEPSMDVARAAKTLLELASRLRNINEHTPALEVVVGAGAANHEPFI